MKVYRLSSFCHAETIWSGDGSLIYSGRWHDRRAEFPVLYTATSISLAAWELYLGMPASQVPEAHALGEADIPDVLIETESDAFWAEFDVSWLELTRGYGTNWLRRGSSLAVMVPSRAVRYEWNLLINPRHLEFKRMVFGATKDFRFDSRLLERESAKGPEMLEGGFAAPILRAKPDATILTA